MRGIIQLNSHDDDHIYCWAMRQESYYSIQLTRWPHILLSNEDDCVYTKNRIEYEEKKINSLMPPQLVQGTPEYAEDLLVFNKVYHIVENCK